MAASAKPPLWKRLLIVLSAAAVGIAVPFALDQAGVSRWPAWGAGVVALFVTFWVVAALLHVRVMRHWEES